MKTPAPAFVCLLVSVSAHAVDFKNPPGPADIDRVFAEGFPAASGRLEREFAAAHKPGAPQTPAFTAWLDLWRWCGLLARDAAAENRALVQRRFFREKKTGTIYYLPVGNAQPPELETLDTTTAAAALGDASAVSRLENEALPAGSRLASGRLSEIVGGEFARELLADPSFSRAFFSTVSDSDYFPLVLANLREIRESHPTRWREFSSLAIALAVVSDSALPPFWPHAQVAPNLVPKGVPPVAEQFAAWSAAASTPGKLLLDPRKLSPSQLKFALDAFVEPSELDWARKNVRLSRSNFGRAFDQVRYRGDRIKSRAFEWAGGPYTLAAISGQGGICVDQAHFAAIAGKARGLPTLFFTGQGSDGGHAWFGYMRGDDRWELDCGRYSQQNYAVGRALDPQSWLPISDHELKLLSARFRDKPAFAAAMNELAMASVYSKNGDPLRARACLDAAIRACPESPEAWDAKAAHLAATGAPPSEAARFREEAIRRFSNVPDLKVRHQQALAEIRRSAGDSLEAQKIERQISTQNRRSRSDLSVSVAAQKVRTLLDAGDIDAAAAEFHRQLLSIGKEGGGNFANEVAVPFLTALLESGNKTRARRTLAILRRELSPERGQPLDLLLAQFEAASR